MPRVLTLWTLVLCLCAPCLPQTPAITATAVLTQMDAATGWTVATIPADAIATGSVTAQKPTGPVTQSIVVKARPGHQVRMELPNNGIVTIVNGEAGYRTTPSSAGPLQPGAVYSLGAWMFPFFTSTVQNQDPSFSITYLDTETISGGAANRISIAQTFNIGDGLDQARNQTAAVVVAVSSSTNLPVRIEHTVLADDNPSATLQLNCYLSDYRTVGTLLVPFHIEEYSGSQLVYTIQFDTIQTNVGLPDSQFSIL